MTTPPLCPMRFRRRPGMMLLPRPLLPDETSGITQQPYHAHYKAQGMHMI